MESQGGKYISIKVTGPLGLPVDAKFGIINKNVAIIEMASASGLWLVPESKRNPMKATTYGTGQLIKKALDLGCRRFIVGIGGSATTDGGMGMAQALGVKFYDKDNKLLEFGGEQLLRLGKIDISGIHPSVKSALFEVALLTDC